jgi:alpha-tubulin suppressor-like RCC1 family protein
MNNFKNKVMNKILLTAALLVAQFVNAQQASFSGITDGQVLCTESAAVTLTGNFTYGTFSGSGVTDNNNATATFNPADAGVGTHEISYVVNPGFTQIATCNHTLGIKSDGTLWSWGKNSNGELGDGTYTNKNIPTKMGTDNDWKMVAAGTYHSLAIKTDGTLWAWGKNDYSQLGDGTTNSRNTPVQIGTATNWKSIQAGEYHSLALKSDGTLWAWGDNYYNQLGDGTSTTKSTPTQIGTAANWQSIAAGVTFNLAIKTDGTLWGWGHNNNGQVGDGTTDNKDTPIQIGTATNWQTISANNHSLATKSDGTLWAWGGNYFGELGDQTFITKHSPIQIGTATNWQTVAAGAGFSLGIRSNGTLWAWGSNDYGQYGDGTRTSQNIPINTGTATSWQIIEAGASNSILIQSDGSLWGTGFNYYGQVGNGTETDIKSFALVSEPKKAVKSVTVESVNAGVTLNSNTLTADLAGATYQWVDCNNSNAPIAGATGQAFTPTTTGNYAVIVTKGSCSKTSACTTISSLSVGKWDSEAVTAYPNPTLGSVYLNDTGDVEVFDLNGHLILKQKNTNLIDLSQHPIGAYILKLKNKNGIGTTRIIKN